MSQHRSSRLHRSFFLSYLIIFIVPFLILLLYYFPFQKYLKNQLIRSNAESLQKAVGLLDTQIEQLQQLSIQLSLDSDLSPVLLKNDPYGVLSVQKELKKMVFNNDFIYDAYLYYHGDDYLLSYQTSASFEMFCSNLYGYENWDAETMKQDLLSVSYPISRGEEIVVCRREGDSAMPLVTFLYPVGNLTAQSQYATLVVLVKQQTINKLLQRTTASEDTSFYIYGLNNPQSPAFSMNMESGPELSAVQQLLDSHDATKTVRSGRHLYSLAVEQSALTGLQYVSAIPLDILFSEVNQMQLIFTLVLCVLFVAGGCLVAFFANRSYRPIRSLGELADQLSELRDSGEPVNRNELFRIRRSLEALSSRNLALQSEISDSKVYLRDSLIFDLLRGEFNTVRQFHTIAARVGLRMEGDLYAAAVIYQRGSGAEGSLRTVEEIQKSYRFPFDFYVHLHFDGSKIVLILNPTQEQQYDLSALLEQFRLWLEEKDISRGAVIGLGDCYPDIAYLSKSFLEADTAVDYRIVLGCGKVIEYAQCIPKENSSFKISQKIEPARLRRALNSGDYDGVNELLCEIEQEFSTSVYPIFVVKSICFDIMQEIKNAVAEMNLPDMPEESGNMLDLLEYDTTQELFDSLRVFCRQFCSAVREQQGQDSAGKLQRMLHYVDDEYCDPAFSTDKMAEQFSMTATALCQYFKKQTGKTITDYLVELRMERAKELLLSTTLPLSQIASEVGYYNVSSFIRRFKQYAGDSPGAWRIAHSK